MIFTNIFHKRNYTTKRAVQFKVNKYGLDKIITSILAKFIMSSSFIRLLLGLLSEMTDVSHLHQKSVLKMGHQ